MQARGHAVRIFDHQLERDIAKAVAEFKPDAVAITLLSQTMIPDAMESARAMKALGLPVFWGGHMASAIPEEIARSGLADYVGISEGEYTLLELLEVVAGRRAPDTVPGVAYVDENGEYHRTPDRPFADLADFPPLDYSLVPMGRFASGFLFADRVFMMVTSKGCPHQCTFCFNREYHRCQRRAYPREVIFRQIETLVRDYGADGLIFGDEVFGTDKRELRAFCEGLKALNLGVKWYTESVVGALARSDLALMYDAGCRMLAFGLECGSAEMRKKIHKYYDASKVDETFRNCREVGIRAAAFFIIGFPGETPGQVRETVRLYFRLQPDSTGLCLYLPIPGSQLYRELEASGQLRPKKTLEAYGASPIGWNRETENFSRVPTKELRVILHYINWQMAFQKKRYRPGFKRDSPLKLALSNLLAYLRCAGPRGFAHGLWNAAAFFLAVAWDAHAYPAIRKKYDLYAKNFGRTDWD